MDKLWRKRCGYLWATEEENERIEKVIKSSGIYKTSRAIITRADFIRVATIAMGELLKKKRLKINKNANQEEVINSIVNIFSQ